MKHYEIQDYIEKIICSSQTRRQEFLFAYLAVSKTGLTEQELRLLWKDGTDRAFHSILENAYEFCYFEPNGRIHIKNRSVKEWLLNQCYAVSCARGKIVKRYKGFQRKNRKEYFAEIAEQFYYLERTDDLVKMMVKHKVMRALNTVYHRDWIKYMDMLYECGECQRVFKKIYKRWTNKSLQKIQYL